MTTVQQSVPKGGVYHCDAVLTGVQALRLCGCLRQPGRPLRVASVSAFAAAIKVSGPPAGLDTVPWVLDDTWYGGALCPREHVYPWAQTRDAPLDSVTQWIRRRISRLAIPVMVTGRLSQRQRHFRRWGIRSGRHTS